MGTADGPRNIVERTKAATGLDLQRLLERFGAPTLIAVLILLQLEPKIDHGIAIADHVDAQLSYLAAVGCGPPPRQNAIYGYGADSPLQFPAPTP